MLHPLLILTLRQSFEDNSTLEGILGDLIIPSVKRKELAMREKALASLGLCCLIAKVMHFTKDPIFMPSHLFLLYLEYGA